MGLPVDLPQRRDLPQVHPPILSSGHFQGGLLEPLSPFQRYPSFGDPILVAAILVPSSRAGPSEGPAILAPSSRALSSPDPSSPGLSIQVSCRSHFHICPISLEEAMTSVAIKGRHFIY